MKLKLGLAALLLAGGIAHAAPVASGLPAGFGFSSYTGAAAVGAGLVDTRDVLFYIGEQAVAGVKSWYIFFDPAGVQAISGTITFDTPIVSVLATKALLDGSNSTYGIDVDGDGMFNDYATSLLIAPEASDLTAWSAGGNTVTIDWRTVDPGDHIRVLVQANAVPEPGTLGLAGIGLLLLGWGGRRQAGLAPEGGSTRLRASPSAADPS